MFNKQHPTLQSLDVNSWGQAPSILGTGLFNKEHAKLKELNVDSWGKVRGPALVAAQKGLFNKQHPKLKELNVDSWGQASVAAKTGWHRCD